MRGAAARGPGGDPAVARVLYVGGIGRSGSTLLDRMLGSLDGVCSVGELVHLWSRGVAAGNRCGCGARFGDCPFWSEVGRKAFGGWDGVDLAGTLRLQRAVDRTRYLPLLVAPWLWPPYRRRLERYAELLGRVLAAVREVSGARLVVDASKHVSTAYLLRRVPGVDLRAAHLVRDSRGVAYSWTRTVSRPEVVAGDPRMATGHPLRLGARWVAHNLLLQALPRLGVPARPVRYEHLVERPRAELAAVLRLAGHEGADLSLAGDGEVELPAGHGLAGNPMRFRHGRVPLRMDSEWRRRLPLRHRVLLLVITWPLLARYGYLHAPSRRARRHR